MIARLRKRFIVLAMTAVAAVLVCLGVAINVADYVTTTRDLDNVLNLIEENQGDLTMFKGGRGRHGDMYMNGRPFTEDTVYGTRWFSITYEEEDGVIETDLTNISAVDEDDLTPFVNFIAATSEGYGFFGQYRYLISSDGEIDVDDVAEGDVETEREAIFLDATDELYNMRSLATLTTLVAAVAFVVIFFVVWFVSGKVIRPFVEADARQKRFITDASHELKTPLAVIQTSLSVLEMEVGHQKWIDKAQAASENMGQLVDDLVTLSRLEEAVDASPETFDASAAVEDTARSFEDHAIANGHDLALSIAPHLEYTGDRAAVERLVSVLLDNAVRYAAPDGGITLALQRSGRRSLLLTCENPVSPDSGRLVDEDEIAHLFERFYRPDTAREKGTGGFGIGLSIAQSICEATGGSITASLIDGHTIRFEALLK